MYAVTPAHRSSAFLAEEFGFVLLVRQVWVVPEILKERQPAQAEERANQRIECDGPTSSSLVFVAGEQDTTLAQPGTGLQHRPLQFLAAVRVELFWYCFVWICHHPFRHDRPLFRHIALYRLSSS
jgi:hypothetical protein